MTASRFYRKVGFGLRPDELLPANRLQWAADQIETIPPLIWSGEQRDAAQMQDIRVSFTTAERVLEQTIRDEAELRQKRETLYNQSGRRYFEPYELAMRHYQAAHSDRGVFERFQHFWGNHFAIVDKNKLPTFNTGVYQRETIRNQMDKTFRDLVMAATLSFPMMRSLDNFLSRGPNSAFAKGNRGKRNVTSLNENHGRELLELHTVSPEAGYTQDDVIHAAYIMTGWGIWDGRKEQEGKTISYDGHFHEPGSHKVLGKNYQAKGWNDKEKGENQLAELVADLCAHPSCIRFIATKLCRHFICDRPTEAMITHVMAAYQATDGLLPALHLAVLEAADRYGDAYQKFQSPEIWLLQSARMLGGEWPGKPSDYETDFTAKPENKMRMPRHVLAELGHLPYRPAQPNGFPDDKASWLSPEYLARRLAIAQGADRLSLYDASRPLSDVINDAVARNFEDGSFWHDMHKSLGNNAHDKKLCVAFLCSKEVLQS